MSSEVVNGVTQKIEKKRKKAKFYCDRTAKKLPELVIGDHVRLEPRPNDPDRTWKSGTCISKVGPRSYLVDCEGTVRRCNSKSIRSTNEKSWCDDWRYPKVHLMRMNSNSAFYSVRLCVIINFSLHHNVLCLSFVVVLHSIIACTQLLKWFSLMKEAVMCNKNLRLISPLKVNRHYSLLKHRNFDFHLFRGEGGVTLILNLIFRRVV